MGAYFLVSAPDLATPTEPGALPPRLGLDVLDRDGRRVGETATCTGLHGEAGSGGIVAFGCVEGVLVARPDGGKAPRVEMLAYGEAMPEGRVGTLVGGKAMQFFLGDYGADKLVLIDPSSDAPFRVGPCRCATCISCSTPCRCGSPMFSPRTGSFRRSMC
jgi:hypothetical protein